MSPFRRNGQPDEEQVRPPGRHEQTHGRRALSWSPERGEEQSEPEPAPAAAPSTRAGSAVVERPPTPIVQAEPAAVRVPPAGPARAAEGARDESEDEPRKRGRPRGRKPRRQVHFHVDQEEEKLLLAAARQHGSQQKGLIAALESLRETEFLRHEIERLEAECEQQRRLLADAEALFRR